MLPTKVKPQKHQIYNVTFEEYLQPKKKNLQKEFAKKCRAIQKKKTKKRELHLNLLENPIFIGVKLSAWQKLRAEIQKRCRTSHQTVQTEGMQAKNSKTSKFLTKLKKFSAPIKLKNSQKIKKAADLLRLPKFLAFLLERNDDGLCKRKTGFEIYCELASIHGFINFVGARTWQRIFWCLIICVAIVMSGIFLLMSHLINLDTPTILYTESTTYPAWTMPFPAVTLCNLNRISKIKAVEVAKKFALKNPELSQQQLLRYFALTLHHSDNINFTQNETQAFHKILDNNNYTLAQLRRDISNDCAAEMLSCKWRGYITPCENLFQKIETTEGQCCTFNYQLLPQNDNSQPELAYSCGRKTGLIVLIDPKLDDYMASLTKMSGYQVLIHGNYDHPNNDIQQYFVRARSESMISVTPTQTYATDYVYGQSLNMRRCYIPKQRQLVSFSTYTQLNCLTECRAKMLYDKCHCVPNFLPNLQMKWRVCSINETACIREHKDVLTMTHIKDSTNYICDCFPNCNFNQYTSVLDSATLNRTFSFGDKHFFKDIKVYNHILLHVFYKTLTAERLRMDVYENWLSFVGTFGGIAGLHMGYSFVSLFEMIFFVFVRPACNWLTKKQIRYRLKRRQKKAAAAKKAQEYKKQNENEIINSKIRNIFNDWVKYKNIKTPHT